MTAVEDLPVIPSNEGCDRPCLLIAHPDTTYAAFIGRGFRRLGWDVYMARGGAEARRLNRMLAPDLVLLATEFPDETGWLVCDKLRRERSQTCVYLVADSLDGVHPEFVHFVGARGVLSREETPERMLDQVRGQRLSVAS